MLENSLYDNQIADIIKAQNDDKSAMEKLITTNSGLIWSIVKRFKEYDFNLDENKIFARDELDKFNSKGEFFENYMKKNNYQKALFVDDNINNINSCKNYPQIETILALWGNCEPNSDGCNQKEAIEKINSFF